MDGVDGGKRWRKGGSRRSYKWITRLYKRIASRNSCLKLTLLKYKNDQKEEKEEKEGDMLD